MDATKAHKWLGCLLSTSNAGNREADLDFRLPATSKAFYANKWILCDKNVSLNSRIKFFDSVVTSVVRFGADQRKLYKSELCTAVNLCKFLRQVVGPPGGIDWTQPWHSILHQRNQRVVKQMQLNGFQIVAGGGRLGRSFDLWETPVTKFFRGQNIGEWELAAQDKALWLQYTEDCVSFMQM